MRRTLIPTGCLLFAILAVSGLAPRAVTPASPIPLIEWSREAQRAIVPSPGGVGDKFPGEAAVYMGIVHAAMYDVPVAIHGGYRPYARAVTAAGDVMPAAAIAAAAHHVLVGLLPAQVTDLDGRYADYLSRLPDTDAKAKGIVLGKQIASAVLALRANDGRNGEIQYRQPPPAAGVFEADPTRAVVGFRLSRLRPIVLESPNQFRPGAPRPLNSQAYAADLEEVRRLGRFESELRTDEQTRRALFWTDHDVDQWHEGLLRLASDRGLDLMQTARMLALAHVSGGDAMIACFDAKYQYAFWRPVTAINATDKGRVPDASWRPLRTTPNHPEYPAAHACHTGAIAEALRSFFGTDDVRVSLGSRTTGTTHTFDRLPDIVKDVEDARVFAGFHFRSSNLTGAQLGRDVARFVATRSFQAVMPNRRE